jgi:chaperonin GroES
MEMMDDQLSAGTNPTMPPEGGMMPAEEPVAQGPSAEEADTFAVDKILNEVNIAEKLRNKKDGSLLNDIGAQVVRDYETDEESREEWMKRNEDWMKLATQVVEKKTFPWDGAANVKYPLLSMAALQFSARAYSSLIPSFDVVKAKVIGPDPDGSMTDKANTLSTHMSHQLLYEMEGWEDDMDTLCFVLPIVGVMFKKTYYSEQSYSNVSELVHAKDLVVNYYTKSLSKASRYTHILYYTPNEIKEKQLYGMFLEYDEDFGPGAGDDRSVTRDGSTSGVTPPGREDDDTPRKILEQYRRLDLDEDGYKEPYIVTVDYETHRVLRISPNFSVRDVDRDDEGKIRCIKPRSWFTKYGFLPNPDGGFYDLGFGLLLGGINEAVNTLTNQMLDSGTLNNLNAGFIAKGLRLGGKNIKLRPGEWLPVNAIGDDLRKGIVPLPANPPSPVLFQLLGTLAQAGKELASVAEIFTGKMPGQNTPAATTMATIEQGLKVFTSIYKRIYRSMQQEFIKLFELNCMYMPTEVVRFVAETNGVAKNHSVSRFDYQGIKVKIIPAADPNMVSETQKMMKIQGLHELVQLGTINVQEMTRQALTFQGQENIQALMTLPEQPPPMEITLLQMELADKDKDRQLEMMKLQSETRKRESEIVLNLAKAKQLGDTEGAMMLEMQLEKEKASAEIEAKWMELLFKREEHKLNMQQKQEEHAIDREVKMSEAAVNQQVLQHKASVDMHVKEKTGEQQIKQGEEMHKQKMKQAEETRKVKEKNGKSDKARVG